MLKFKKLSHRKKKQRGMAVIEAIPVLFMMVMIFNFSLGFFGAIQTGILNQIGSYNYALETFRYRSNLMYFRPGGGEGNYSISQNRVHGTLADGSEQDPNSPDDKSRWPATIRDITFNYVKGVAPSDAAADKEYSGGQSDHTYKGRGDNNNIMHVNSTYTPDGGPHIQTTRIWVKTVYGICLNADCSADGPNDRQGE
ncbi:MAG: hypothetical protein ACXWQQ_13310 [Pseudobdellovibrio sp.]